VINSNLCRISHRFGESAAYWSKIANSYPPHPHSTPSLGMTPQYPPETRMMGLPCGEEIMIVGRTMWTQSTSVTDRQTGRQTDRIMISKTVQCIASHGKNRDLHPPCLQGNDDICQVCHCCRLVCSNFVLLAVAAIICLYVCPMWI